MKYIPRKYSQLFVDAQGELNALWCGQIFSVVGVEEFGSWVIK